MHILSLYNVFPLCGVFSHINYCSLLLLPLYPVMFYILSLSKQNKIKLKQDWFTNWIQYQLVWTIKNSPDLYSDVFWGHASVFEGTAIYKIYSHSGQFNRKGKSISNFVECFKFWKISFHSNFQYWFMDLVMFSHLFNHDLIKTTSTYGIYLISAYHGFETFTRLTTNWNAISLCTLVMIKQDIDLWHGMDNA